MKHRAYLRDRLDEARRKIERITWRLTADRKGHTDDFRNTDSIVHPAFSHYEPKPYPGKIVLLQSSEWPKSPYFDFKLGWEDLAGGIDFYRVAGDHAYMFDEPNVESVAQTLESYLKGRKPNHRPDCSNSCIASQLDPPVPTWQSPLGLTRLL